MGIKISKKLPTIQLVPPTPHLHKKEKSKNSMTKREKEIYRKIMQGGRKASLINRQRRRKRHTPIPPDTTAANKTGSFEIGEHGKDVRVTNAEHLTSLQNDVNYLWPQLLKEIETQSPKTGGNFKGVVIERQLWKRFIHSYARFFGNISKSCDYCGISRNHLYRARERYPTLAVFCKLVDDRFIDEVEETTKRHSLLPNSVVERFFLLKVHRKETYGESDKEKPLAVEVKFTNLQSMREPIPKQEVITNGSNSVGGK